MQKPGFLINYPYLCLSRINSPVMQWFVKMFTFFVLIFVSVSVSSCQQAKELTPAPVNTLSYLNIPQRPANDLTGLEFAKEITGLSLADREKAVALEFLSGNVPSFSRKLKLIKTVRTLNGKKYELAFFAACDYLAIGSDENYLYMPLTPGTAQYLADKLGCTLPTKKMVDLIYNSAEIKLRPQPIPPSDSMTTVPVFVQHTDSIQQQISELGIDRSENNILAGHKKDIIISNKIYSPDRNFGRVVIYGWHLSAGHPIQPVFNGHNDQYADYSHGERFIADTVYLNGKPVPIEKILKDPVLSGLLSDEGVIAKPYYPVTDPFSKTGKFPDTP